LGLKRCVWSGIMAVVKEKVCRGESQRSIALSGKLKKDGVEGVSSAASAAYLNLF